MRDASGALDGYEGPGDSGDEQDEHAELRRAGYRTVPSACDSEEEPDKPTDDAIPTPRAEEAVPMPSDLTGFLPDSVNRSFQQVGGLPIDFPLHRL